MIMCEINNMLDIVYDEQHPDTCMLDMYLPNTDYKPCPVLVYFHGGGLECGSRKSRETDVIKGLVLDGIAVISASLFSSSDFVFFSLLIFCSSN